MNILPKKSWHVRTKRNIERVRRDEANAAEEEKKLKKRIQLAEQEARTELLRKRANVKSHVNEDHVKDTENFSNEEVIGELSKRSKSYTIEDHVNLFKDIEQSGGSKAGSNKEHDLEEKARQEKFEKDIGLLTYLGQSSLEAKGEAPWYLKSSSKESLTAVDGKDETPSSKHKSQIDPLNTMKKYLSAKEKSGDFFIYNKDKKELSKDRSNKEQKLKLSKLEELRAKRLKREKEERQRSQDFLQSFQKGSAPQPEPVLDDRTRKYNSQFNPHLARNNIPTQQYRFT